MNQPVVFEFVFPIGNIEFRGSEFKIGNVIFKRITSDNEIQIRRNIIIEEQFDPYIGNLGNAIALVEESGNDFESMKEKAKEKVDVALNILKVSLSLGIFFRDESALFSRTELILSRKKGEIYYDYSWHREFRPLLVPFDPNKLGKCGLCLTELSNNLFNMPEGFLEPLRRAVFWIAQSIKEDNLDLKNVCIHIALESMLTSIDLGKKGEDLSYKMLLLSFWDGGFLLWPKEVLDMYKIRSFIIHQGKMGNSTRDDCDWWRRISIDILIRSISFIKMNKVMNHREFVEKLESKERIDEVKLWLNSYRDDKACYKILDWINGKQKKAISGIDGPKCHSVKEAK